MRKSMIFVLISTGITRAWAQQASDHVPPDPPQHAMPAMSDAEMARTMEMDDNAKFAMFKLDNLERSFGSDAHTTTWDAEAWYGSDFDKLWLRSEGERASHRTDARIEALWDHAFASYWDWQIGARHDFTSGSAGNAPDRNWAAFGVQGLAPYWFEIEATVYIGDGGRMAARFRAEYELPLTQRLILQPEMELNWYDRRDRARDIAAGLSDAEAGLRLRYEIRREIAPYIGLVWKHRRGDDAFARENGTQWVAGLRLWF